MLHTCSLYILRIYFRIYFDDFLIFVCLKLLSLFFIIQFYSPTSYYDLNIYYFNNVLFPNSIYSFNHCYQHFLSLRIREYASTFGSCTRMNDKLFLILLPEDEISLFSSFFRLLFMSLNHFRNYMLFVVSEIIRR